MYKFRVLAELLQNFVYYPYTQTQQDIVQPAKSISTNRSPQHSRKTHRRYRLSFPDRLQTTPPRVQSKEYYKVY